MRTVESVKLPHIWRYLDTEALRRGALPFEAIRPAQARAAVGRSRQRPAQVKRYCIVEPPKVPSENWLATVDVEAHDTAMSGSN